ncbi:MAG: hypothetical protein GY801_32070 [bacterium]|nr:hypothetical protein [bacterium]
MGSINTVNLKFKYSFFGVLFVLFCIAATCYPAWKIALWLADILSIPDNVPVKDQDNGWLWVFLFLLEASGIFVTIYGLCAFMFSKIAGWSAEQYINIFWKSKYPKQWRKY